MVIFLGWTRQLDEYCERLGPEFWAEPINAITNLSFVVGALFAYRLGKRLQVQTIGFYLLVAVLSLIGVGSFLYHTFANVWSLLADVLPIYVFKLVFIAVYSGVIARNLGVGKLLVGSVMLAAFVGLTLIVARLPQDWLNGSISYLPALLVLISVAVYHVANYRVERFTLALAAGCFFISLTFRSIDMALCEALPIGTHFIWHLLNGYLLYLVIRGYLGTVVAGRE